MANYRLTGSGCSRLSIYGWFDNDMSAGRIYVLQISLKVQSKEGDEDGEAPSFWGTAELSKSAPGLLSSADCYLAQKCWPCGGSTQDLVRTGALLLRGLSLVDSIIILELCSQIL